MSLEDTLGYGCDGVGDESKICDCLGCALKSIAASTAKIAAILDERMGKPCDQIDQCMDKIIEELKKRIEGPLYAKEECKRMVQNGMAGTLEYAVRCAHGAADECDTICTLGDPTTEGKCCNYCGSDKCKCENGECVPVEEEEEEEGEKKYRGWCNRYTGIVVVTGKDDPHPGGGFEQVAFTVTEEAALAQAKANCGRILPPGTPPDRLPNIPGGEGDCDVFSYLNGQAFSKLNAQAVAANLLQGQANFWSGARRLGLDGVNLGNIGDVLYGIFQAYTGYDSIVAQEGSGPLVQALGCNNLHFQSALKALASISNISSAMGFDASPWTLPYVYMANAACRQQLLSTDQAIASYLANGMSLESLNAHAAVNGLCEPSLYQDLHAKKSKPVPLQLAFMRRRRMIDNEGYHSGMRQLGYLEPQTAEQLFKLTEQVPTMSDIIRFMVRDADDPDTVGRFGLDEGFTKKYNEGLREWSEFQGVSEKQALYSWRAHWNIPSPTQLFQFWHRLRYNPKFGGKKKLQEDIKQAMIQQDILPFWHEHYLAVSFRTMRLVDIRRSFQIGAMKDDELVPAYLQLGFSDDDAEKMRLFTIRLRDRAVINERPVKLWLRLVLTRDEAKAQLKADGIPDDVIDRALASAEPDFIKSPYSVAFSRGDITAEELREALTSYGVSGPAIVSIVRLLSLKLRNHVAVARYKVGVIERADAKATMQIDGMMASTAERLLKETDVAVNLEFVKACQQGIKRRFLMGELDRADAIAELNRRGTINSRAIEMVNWWDCELKSGEKQVSAAKLCEWLARGAITSVDFTSRLRKIGYSDTDAALMLDDCLISVSTAQAAKAKREAKEQAAEQNRIARILEKQAAQTARYNAQLQRNRQTAARLKTNREKTMLSAATELTPKCECHIQDALNLVRNESGRLVRDYALSIDESLQVVMLAAKEFTGPDTAEYVDICSRLAQAAVDAALNGTPSEFHAPQSTNGATVPS